MLAAPLEDNVALRELAVMEMRTAARMEGAVTMQMTAAETSAAEEQ